MHAQYATRLLALSRSYLGSEYLPA